MSAALITGASAGLGVTFARRMAQAGHDVVLVARRADRLRQVAEGITRDYPVRAEILAADLATDEGVARVVEFIRGAELEVLINNAGFGTGGLFFEAELSGQEQMHRLHVLATMRLTHAALKKMVAQGKGAIINVSSVAAFATAVGSVSYGSTKAWINAFTLGLAAELQAVGSPVKVQALCPGFTVTEFHDAMGMDRALIPRWLWLPAESVVDTSLRALDRGQVIAVTGWQYKLLVGALKAVPSGLLRRFSRGYARRLKRVR